MNDVKMIVRLGLVAALYVALTMASYPLSYELVQFRISEVLVLLAFYRKDYGIALIIGCAISNAIGPYGVIDVVFGSIATALSVLCIMKSKNLIVASLFPVIFNGLIVGFELWYTAEIPFITASLWVAFGEFVVICVLGVILFKVLEKKKFFFELIQANQNCPIEKTDD